MGLFSNSISKKKQFLEKIDSTNDFLLKKGVGFKSLSEFNLEMMKICNSQSEKLIEFYDFLDKAEMDNDLKGQINNELSKVIKNQQLSINRINHLWELILRYLKHLNYV
jgi:plasmid maintenance system killer protein